MIPREIARHTKLNYTIAMPFLLKGLSGKPVSLEPSSQSCKKTETNVSGCVGHQSKAPNFTALLLECALCLFKVQFRDFILS